MSDPTHGLTTAQPCVVHSTHIPSSHVNEIHHVWPKGHGGPDIPENRIVICATGHNTVHQLIDELILTKGDVPWSLSRHYAAKERALAKLGYERIVRQAM